MYISDFRYHRPQSVEEVISLLEQINDAALIAGGTDLLVEIKKGMRHHEDIISLNDIEALKGIREEGPMISIGAGVTHNELLSSGLIRDKLPAISNAVTKIGCDQVRNKGTVGGNLCTAASCCDLGPILMAFEAVVELRGSITTRRVPVREFFIFHRKTVLGKGELMTRILVPIPSKGTGLHYEKFGLREAAAVSVASVAVMVKIKDGICENAIIVLGAVAPTPIISSRAAGFITGKALSELSENSTALIQAGQMASEDAIPIDDIRGGAAYRRDILKAITKRSVLKAITNAQINQQVS